MPAPFFQKIKDYPKGYRILGGPLASFKRLAIALDLNPDASWKEIFRAYDERKKHIIKPRLVKDGPCKENIYSGDEVDLYRLPVPFIHGGDGGRYLSTWHIVVTKDPDSEWVNWGMYRQMVHTKNSLGGIIFPAQHIGIIYRQKYELRNKPMEFAVAIGTDPICSFVAASPVPFGVSEVEVAGGLRGEPVDVVKCETVDLEVPATSEIVLEGEVLPKVRKVEGPFGEYAGYRAIPSVPRPVFNIKAITHRSDPILTMSCMGVPIDDADVVQSIAWSSEVYSALRGAGFPVTGVYVPPESASTMVIVATKTPYANIASRIAGSVWATGAGSMLCKILVVDDDIDPTNMQEVIHAWSTKCHPVRGTLTIPQAVIVPAVPYFSPEEKLNDQGANVCYDCTWPHRWPKEEIPLRSSFNDTYPDDVKKKVLKNWTQYGFSG